MNARAAVVFSGDEADVVMVATKQCAKPAQPICNLGPRASKPSETG